MIYLDQSATSLHKPPQVAEAVLRGLSGGLGNPGRAGHAPAHSALREVAAARRELARYFGVSALQLAFTFNATMALNMAIRGALGPRDRVLTTSWSHNSMLRPLYQLQKEGMKLDLLMEKREGGFSAEDFRKALQPDTTAVAVNAMSNVSGDALPLDEVAALCAGRGLLMILDLAQWAGVRAMPDLTGWPPALMAFTGHKSLYGPQGTGGLIRLGDVPLRPVFVGGSGVHSFDREHPGSFPEVCEAGTPNVPGIMGLAAGVRWLAAAGQQAVEDRLAGLRRRFVSGLAGIPAVRVYGAQADAGPVAALNLGGLDAAWVCDALDTRFGIAARCGAHCAPLWHEAMGTRGQGAVRFSFSYFNTEAEIDAALAALKQLAEEERLPA